MRSSPLHTPWFLFLLPVFFVFHGFVENFHYIRWVDCLPLLGLYVLVTLLCFLIFRFFLRNTIKAALMTSFIMAFYLFFGALHTFLHNHLPLLGRYIVLLPLFVIMSVVLFIRLKRRPPFVRLVAWLNCLLLVYLLTDIVSLWQKRDSPLSNTPSVTATPSFQACDSCPKPDIYLLLFDEYTSTKALKDVYHYDNSSLDSFLVQEGFHILPDSRSNYNSTVFSMASVFNSTYLTLRDPGRLTYYDYMDMMALRRPAAVLDFLRQQGYAIINYSSFDLPGHPAPVGQSFFFTGARLIDNSTLLNRINHDIGWHWVKKNFLQQPIYLGNIDYESNQRLLALTREESRNIHSGPRFIYTHLYLPHYPYLFDSLQSPVTHATGLSTEVLRSYLGYIPYTNARIRELISDIKRNTKGKAVILFLSDHGFRYEPLIGHNQQAFFSNQNAVYFPDMDYRTLYDSLSNVNEFRVVFNKLFRQNIPLLKDSTVFLQDAIKK